MLPQPRAPKRLGIHDSHDSQSVSNVYKTSHIYAQNASIVGLSAYHCRLVMMRIEMANEYPEMPKQIRSSRQKIIDIGSLQQCQSESSMNSSEVFCVWLALQANHRVYTVPTKGPHLPLPNARLNRIRSVTAAHFTSWWCRSVCCGQLRSRPCPSDAQSMT